MRVIFLRDIPKIGKKGHIKDVADGFAHNNLIPRKLAVPATEGNIKRFESERAAHAHADEVRVAEVRDLVARSKSAPVLIRAAANERGHLFQGLRPSQIVAAIRDAYNIVLDEKDVHLDRPLKEAGNHAVAISAPGYRGECLIIIEPLTRSA